MEKRAYINLFTDWVVEHPEVKVSLTWIEGYRRYQVEVSTSTRAIRMYIDPILFEFDPKEVLDDLLARLSGYPA